ncbi:hypothetical protein NBRC116586_21990 [Pseudooceanicola nitratireducens]
MQLNMASMSYGAIVERDMSDNTENTEKKAAMSHYAVIDFEASSLSSDSWPIEIGLSWLDEGQVRTWSSLMRPSRSWSLDDWSDESAAVHRIPIEIVHAAPCVDVVAARFFEVLGTRQLVSDAPVFETHWLTRMTEAADQPAKGPVLDFHRVSFANFSGLALDLLYETIERKVVPHRAGPDSARLVAGWRRALAHHEDHLS